MTHTFTVFALNDAYEVIWNGTGVHCILKYHHGLDCRGEEVDYDNLPPTVQKTIYSRLVEEIKNHHYDRNNNDNN